MATSLETKKDRRTWQSATVKQWSSGTPILTQIKSNVKEFKEKWQRNMMAS